MNTSCEHLGQVQAVTPSANRHATAHWNENPEHPLVGSFEPGQDWWCYGDDLAFEVQAASSAPSYHRGAAR